MNRRNALLPLCLGSLLVVTGEGAISFTGDEINQTFTGYDGTAGPVGWTASGFSDGGFEPRGASSGRVSTGGTYAFDVGGGNTALGVQPGGSDFTPGYYELEVTNDSGATVSFWNIGFDSYFFNDEARGNSLVLSYSTDGSSFTQVAGSSFTSPETADALGWTVGVNYSGSISASVPSGGSLFLRWIGDDSVGSGTRDEFAIDNVTIVPEPSSALLGGLALLGLLRRRR
jgi:hypothetical protein